MNAGEIAAQRDLPDGVDGLNLISRTSIRRQRQVPARRLRLGAIGSERRSQTASIGGVIVAWQCSKPFAPMNAIGRANPSDFCVGKA
jgi:hypothetical protein